jgi:methyl-accepting chemotaxis protein
MKIKTKMLLGGGCLAAIPVLLGCYFLGQAAISTGKASLEEDAKQSLIAIRDITATEITNYINNIEQQALSLSENLMVVDAMSGFRKAYKEYDAQLDNINLKEQEESLESYYQKQFGDEYRKLNDGHSVDIAALFEPLDRTSIALQYDFISDNTDPLGSKHLMDMPARTSSYADLHAKYHPVFRSYIDRFGFYDLFLVDPESGDIIYSVFKELDYTTSLIDGPYANAGIGKAFAMAKKADSKNFSGLTDFAPYVPSYNAPASFIGTSIYDGEEKIGVLILQMPVDKINAVMTYNAKWKETGLGDSGETYLVGPDYTMRSNGRFLLEDKENYLKLMENIGLSSETINIMAAKETSIGLQVVKTKGTEAALAGKKGFDIFPDYRNIRVLSAYKPINIGGLRWAIMSEIDEAEAFAPVDSLRKKVMAMISLIVVLALVAGPMAAWLLGLSILNPVKKIIDAIHDLANGEGDLTQRISADSRSELGELSHWLNKFIEHLDETFSDLIKSAMRLVPMSEELSEGNIAITKAANEQNQQIATVRNRLHIARQSTDQVQQESELIFEESNSGCKTVQEGIRVFDETYEQINQLGNIIGDASVSIDELKIESDKIVSVIDVINSIAEQTNLLALNAAIEAARAGEAGRGFAVVADEVRALASRTRESTLEVSSMVEAIQSGTDSVVSTMSLGKQSTEECNIHVQEAKEKLTFIRGAMNKINDRVDSISKSVLEQKENFNRVSNDFDGLDECFHNSQMASNVTVQIGIDMSKMSVKLHGMVDHFTLTDNSWSTNKRNGMRIDEETVRILKQAAEAQEDQDELF